MIDPGVPPPGLEDTIRLHILVDDYADEVGLSPPFQSDSGLRWYRTYFVILRKQTSSLQKLCLSVKNSKCMAQILIQIQLQRSLRVGSWCTVPLGRLEALLL